MVVVGWTVDGRQPLRIPTRGKLIIAKSREAAGHQLKGKFDQLLFALSHRCVFMQHFTAEQQHACINLACSTWCSSAQARGAVPMLRLAGSFARSSLPAQACCVPRLQRSQRSKSPQWPHPPHSWSSSIIDLVGSTGQRRVIERTSEGIIERTSHLSAAAKSDASMYSTVFLGCTSPSCPSLPSLPEPKSSVARRIAGCFAQR